MKKKLGYAIIHGKTEKVFESEPLNESWLAQACESYAVLRALKGLKGRRGTILQIQNMPLGWFILLRKLGKKKD